MKPNLPYLKNAPMSIDTATSYGVGSRQIGQLYDDTFYYRYSLKNNFRLAAELKGIISQGSEVTSLDSISAIFTYPHHSVKRLDKIEQRDGVQNTLKINGSQKQMTTLKSSSDVSISLPEFFNSSIKKEHRHTFGFSIRDLKVDIDIFVKAVKSYMMETYGCHEPHTSVYNETIFDLDEKSKKTNSDAVYISNFYAVQNHTAVGLYIDNDFAITVLAMSETEEGQLIVDGLNSLIKSNNLPKPVDVSKFYMIAKGYDYFLKPFEINQKFDEKYIDTHFNDDFAEINKEIISLINQDKRGIVMLHGSPGTGKTNYLKYLSGMSEARKVVYLPTYMATSLADPDFITFVTESLSGCVIVLEDAEQVITSRESGESDKNAVSTLLNITDGMMGEALGVLVICTFNTDLQFIDTALLRAGRTKVRYELANLKADKADLLFISLGKTPMGKSMSLADIYNLKIEKTNGPTKQAFGFNA